MNSTSLVKGKKQTNNILYIPAAKSISSGRLRSSGLQLSNTNSQAEDSGVREKRAKEAFPQRSFRLTKYSKLFLILLHTHTIYISLHFCNHFPHSFSTSLNTYYHLLHLDNSASISGVGASHLLLPNKLLKFKLFKNTKAQIKQTSIRNSRILSVEWNGDDTKTHCCFFFSSKPQSLPSSRFEKMVIIHALRKQVLSRGG